jgi:hypothetical protein
MLKNENLFKSICEELRFEMAEFGKPEKTEKELLETLTDSQKVLYDNIITAYDYNQKAHDRMVIKFVLDYIATMCSTRMPFFFD